MSQSTDYMEVAASVIAAGVESDNMEGALSLEGHGSSGLR